MLARVSLVSLVRRWHRTRGPAPTRAGGPSRQPLWGGGEAVCRCEVGRRSRGDPARRGGVDLAELGALFGPAVAAAVVSWRTGRLHESTAGIVRWRVPLRWWAVALGLPLAYFSAWHVGLLLVGNDAVDVSLRTTKAVSYVPLVLALSLVGGGLNEEPGWRGFALPRLPPARRSRLRREWPREPHGSSRHLTSWCPQESDAKADQGDGQQDGSGPGQPGSRRSSLFRSDQHVHEESP